MRKMLCMLLTLTMMITLLVPVFAAEADTPLTDPWEIMNAANKLDQGEELPYDVTLTGIVRAVTEIYNEEYDNISLDLIVDGAGCALHLFRLRGEGVAEIAVDDILTVTGRINNLYGTVELSYGTLLNRISGGGTPIQVETDPLKIVDAAYALLNGEQFAYDVILTGKVIDIDTPFNEEFENISVSFAVEGREDMPILCYRLKGDHVAEICLDDIITVEGRLINYDNIVEMVSGQMLKRIAVGNPTEVPTDPVKIVEAAYRLEPGKSLPYESTLTGTVTEIIHPYDGMYDNITVSMTVPGCEDKPIVCYRMKGSGAEYLKVGCEITVTGQLTHYYASATEWKPEVHTIEFKSGCKLVGIKHETPLPGDVTGDGVLNIIDVARLYGVVRNGKEIQGTLGAADVNNDGKVNIMDVVRIYAHVQGINTLF